MNLRTVIARAILLGLAEAIATTAGIAQETPAATKNTLPAGRKMTAANGRKLEGTILSKDATSIQFRRANDGKEFMVDGLSLESLCAIAALQDRRLAPRERLLNVAGGYPAPYRSKATLPTATFRDAP